MALPSTLKRHDPSSNDNDSLNDDDDDVTWGGKRPRFIYNFVVDDSPLSCDSDETESVHSCQSKSTIQLLSEQDFSCESSWRSDCNTEMTEFDVRSSCSSYNIDSNVTDSSTSGSTMDVMKTEENLNSTMCEKARDEVVLDGYLPDEVSDSQDSNWRVKRPQPPACFKTCLQCGKINANPFFQYCHTCFTYRKNYFVDKPDPKIKSNKPLNSSSQKKDENQQESHEPDIPNSQESTSSGYSSLILSQEENKNLKDLETSMAEKNKTLNNSCNICLQNPKNGIFNHNKIGHIFSCYKCAKKIWKKKGKCPVCKLKIKFVTKLIVV